jgi:hypothetical protein
MRPAARPRYPPLQRRLPHQGHAVRPCVLPQPLLLCHPGRRGFSHTRAGRAQEAGACRRRGSLSERCVCVVAPKRAASALRAMFDPQVCPCSAQVIPPRAAAGSVQRGLLLAFAGQHRHQGTRQIACCPNRAVSARWPQGSHMVPVLRNMGIHCAVLGNHGESARFSQRPLGDCCACARAHTRVVFADFDFGAEVAARLIDATGFPWCSRRACSRLLDRLSRDRAHAGCCRT